MRNGQRSDHQMRLCKLESGLIFSQIVLMVGLNPRLEQTKFLATSLPSKLTPATYLTIMRTESAMCPESRKVDSMQDRGKTSSRVIFNAYSKEYLAHPANRRLPLLHLRSPTLVAPD